MDTDKSVVESTYSFGVPGWLIWITHVVSGIMLGYIGYNILNKKSINPNWGLLLLIFGVIIALYHAHLWYLNKEQPKHMDQPYSDMAKSLDWQPAPQAYSYNY